MKKIEKMALREFKKLSKKEQRRLNKLRRLPTAPPSVRFENKRRKKADRGLKEELAEGQE